MEFVILTTTDMHGRCWDTDLYSGRVQNSMLRVSTAVHGFRERYGNENVLLLDNGDLFQGAPVSDTHLTQRRRGQSETIPAMALCLREIGYDVFVPGNHEFDRDWKLMKEIYREMEAGGVSVLAANVVYDGTDGEHEKGENVFRPYLIRTVEVEGHRHSIGILGLENTDVPRWDVPVHFPGMCFAHPGNTRCSVAEEAERYLGEMREAGCEFIIVAYHGALGNAQGKLQPWENTENQGQRLILKTKDVDLLVLGHDHRSACFTRSRRDRAPIPVVNGGGQNLTCTVLRLWDDASGRLRWEVKENRNLKLADYEVDRELEEKIAPYAEAAMEFMDTPLGEAAGDWDGCPDFYRRQTDTMDLVSLSVLSGVTRRLRELYGAGGASHPALSEGLQADLFLSSVTVSSGYTVRPGPLTVRDVCSMDVFGDEVYVLPVTGRHVREILEENVRDHFRTRILGGRTVCLEAGDPFSALIAGGVSFVCDLSRREGERVRVLGFASGRGFREEQVYLAVVNAYCMGNPRGPLRNDSVALAIPCPGKERIIRDYLARYISGAPDPVLPDFPWRWSVECAGDGEHGEGETAALYADTPVEGGTYLVFHEATASVLTGERTETGLLFAACRTVPDGISAPLPDTAMPLRVHYTGKNRLTLTDAKGRVLTAREGPERTEMTEMTQAEGAGEWILERVHGGWRIRSAFLRRGEKSPRALQVSAGSLQTRPMERNGLFIFNFYTPR